MSVQCCCFVQLLPGVLFPSSIVQSSLWLKRESRRSRPLLFEVILYLLLSSSFVPNWWVWMQHLCWECKNCNTWLEPYTWRWLYLLGNVQFCYCLMQVFVSKGVRWWWWPVWRYWDLSTNIIPVWQPKHILAFQHSYSLSLWRWRREWQTGLESCGLHGFYTASFSTSTTI